MAGAVSLSLSRPMRKTKAFMSGILQLLCWGFISLEILVNIINKYFYCPLFSSKSLNAFGIGIDFLLHHFLNLHISNLPSFSLPT